MRRNFIAIGVFVILGVAALVVFREEPVEAPPEVKAALTAVPEGSLDRIRVVRHEGTGDTLREEEIVVELKDGAWRLTKPVDYAVNQISVERMVTALSELKLIDAIAENKAKHHVLEVDDELGVEVEASGGGEKLAHLIVGVSRDNITMVRLPGSDTVYRVTGAHRMTFNKSVKSLRDKAVVTLDKDSVTSIKFVNEHGELAVERQGEGEEAVYVPVGREIENFDSRKMKGITNALVGLTTRDYADEDPGEAVTGLGEGAARVEYEATKDGEKGSYSLLLGNELEKQRQTYVKHSASEQIFLVSTHMVKRMRAKAEDFARTDEQVAAQEEQRKAAEAHAAEHRAAAAARQAMPPAMSGAPGGGQIPPEVMEKIRKQMAEQKQPGKDGHDHGGHAGHDHAGHDHAGHDHAH